jgi:N-acetylneuraminic acid mutarotase
MRFSSPLKFLPSQCCPAQLPLWTLGLWMALVVGGGGLGGGRLFAADPPPPSVPTSPLLGPVSYQGRLGDNGAPANGSYDFQFLLKDAATAGNSVGGVIRQTLTVQGGVFSTSLLLDPTSFPGADRWIEVRVRPTPAEGSTVSEETAPFAVLERQRIQATPYAFRALSAATVESVSLQSLPPSVPVLDAGGRLSVSLIPDAIARTNAVVDLGGAFQAALQATNAASLAAISTLDQRQTQLSNAVTALQDAQSSQASRLTALETRQASLSNVVVLLTNAVAVLGGQVDALTQTNAVLRQSLEVASAMTRSGWMAASTLPADPSLLTNGFAVVTSVPAPGWMPISTSLAPTARSAAASVWTGQEWIIWGGLVAGQLPTSSGARLRPDLDSWTEITKSEAPTPRSGHTAVWTGTQMIVWGGFGPTEYADDGTLIMDLSRNLNTGGRYTPQPQGWASVSTTGAPSARSKHAAVWTGSRMIVFGGHNGRTGPLGDGASYDPVTDQWSALPATGAPSPRWGAAALWTGSALLVWGGYGPTDNLSISSGALLTFAPDGTPAGWQPLSTASSPSARRAPSTAWDGRRLYVWGGKSFVGALLSDGAVWDSLSNTWSALGTSGAPTARFDAAAVWTGEEFAVFGGSGQIGSGWTGPLATGAAWNPTTGTWRALPSQAPESARSAPLSAWTGSQWLVHGGSTDSGAPLADPQRLEVRPPSFIYRRSVLPPSTPPLTSP